MGLARVLVFLLFVGVSGKRPIRTVHNLYPHDATAIPALDLLGGHAMMRLASKFFVHRESAAKVLAAEFPSLRRKLAIINHGNWMEHYPIPSDLHIYTGSV